MKRSFLFAAAAVVSLFTAGCFSVQKNVGVPGKVIVLPTEKNQKSLPASGFISLGNVWASEQTEFTTEKTKDGIKFEITSHGNTKNMEWSEKKADDDMTLFGGEHIELLIAPYGLNEDGIYYHFSINPAGSIYHAKRRDTDWNPGVKPEIEIKPDCWILKIEIPFTALAMIKENCVTPGTVWNINVARTIKKKGKSAEHSSWTGSSDFHNILSMGQLRFSGNLPKDQLQVYKCLVNNDGKLELDVAKIGKEHAYLQIFDNDELVAVKKMNGAERIKLTCDMRNNYVALKGDKKLSLYLLGPYRVPIQEVSGNLKAYDGAFLNLDKLEYINAKELTCEVFLTPGKAVIKNDKQTFIEQEITKKTSKIPLTGLTPGRYVLEYTSHGKRSSRVFFIAPETLTELPALPENGKLSAAGTDLLLNEKPFYLLGISGGSKTYFPQHPGFTLRYGAGSRKNAIPYQGIPGRRLVRKPVTGYAYQKNWKNTIQKHFDTVKKSGKTSWRLLCYEANLAVLFYGEDGSLKVDPDGHEIYQTIYKMAKDTEPDTLFSIHIDNVIKVKNYVDSCDVLEYATWSSCYHRLSMIKNFGVDFDNIRRFAEEKPLIVWLGGSIPTPDSRTAEEVRAGVYYTILKGGAGNIIHMGHGGMPQNRTRFWSMLSMLSREVESFYNDLKTWKETEIKLPANLLGKAVVSPNGELMAVILNTTGAEVQAEIELPGFGKEKLTFTPYEPRVIRKQKEVKEKK